MESLSKDTEMPLQIPFFAMLLKHFHWVKRGVFFITLLSCAPHADLSPLIHSFILKYDLQPTQECGSSTTMTSNSCEIPETDLSIFISL
jgi:hypothetical protein